MAKNFSVNFNRFDLLRNYSASIIQTSTVALTLNSQKTMLEFDVKLKSLSQKVSELVKLNSLMSYNLISYENLLEAHEFFKQWSELKFVESNPTSGAFKHGKYPFRFLSGVLKSRETWTKLANDSPTIPSFSNTIEQSSKLNKYYEPEKLFTSLPKCVEKLKALKTQPDFDKLSIIDSVVNTFHENARELHDKMSNVHGEFSKVYTDEEAKKIHNILPYDSSSDYENTTLVNKWWDRINDEIKFEPLIEMLDKFIVITKPVKTFVPFLATIKQFTEEDIPQILGSFDGTNILDVIDCIQSSSVDVFSEAIRYNQQVTLLKSKEAEIQYIVDYFKNLTNFQQNIKNSIDKALAEKPKKTREIESLLKIKNIHRVSQEFGGGVQALKAIQQILQKEESVLALANANQDIVRFINDDPFNNKTMKRLKDMITDVKKFNDRVGSRTFNSLSDLWIVFHEAKKIGFHRELDVDAVAKKLSGSTTPNGTEEFLNHLKEVGSLNLNFNMHLTRVLVASMMMKEVNGTLEKIFNPKVEVVKVEKVGVIGIGMR